MNSPTAQPTETNGSATPTLPPKAEKHRKSGGLKKYSFYLWLAAGLGVVLLAVGAYAAVRMTIREPFTGPTTKVKREKLKVIIVERGSLESAENSDIIVNVKAGTRGSTNASSIKWLLDDGTQVKTGDRIIELDDSGFQDTLKTYSNNLFSRKADLIQAEAELEKVKIQNEADLKAADTALLKSKLALSKYCGKLAADKLIVMKTKDQMHHYLKTQFDRDVQEESDKTKKQGDVDGKFTSAYLQEISTYAAVIETARSDKDSWQDRAAWSKRMQQKSLYSPALADADQSRLDSAKIALRKAEGDLDLYREFDRESKVTEFWSDLKIKQLELEKAKIQTEASLKQKKAADEAARAIFAQEQARYDDLKKDEKYYKIDSPQDGMVVYYVPEQSRGGTGTQQSIVAQGEPVREGQKLVRIPNLKKMLVNARIHEAMISKVRPEEVEQTGYSQRLRAAFSIGNTDMFGLASYHVAMEKRKNRFKHLDQKIVYEGQPAFIRVDAFPGRQFKGHVKSKASMASQADFLSSDVKVYQTMISIDDLSEKDDLRVGMNAEVTILAQETSEPVLIIPIQSVVGSVGMQEKRKCYVLDANRMPQERDIIVGHSSDKMVEVKEGLQEGEEVVLNPRALIPEKSDMKPGKEPGGRRGANVGDDDGGDAKKKKKAPGDAAPGQGRNNPSLERPDGGAVPAGQNPKWKKQ